METKTDKVKRLVAQGDYKQALQICKDWNFGNPHHGSVLRLGYACLMYPRFYEQLGYNPVECYQSAINVLHQVYGKPTGGL